MYVLGVGLRPVAQVRDLDQRWPATDGDRYVRALLDAGISLGVLADDPVLVEELVECPHDDHVEPIVLEDPCGRLLSLPRDVWHRDKHRPQRGRQQDRVALAE